MAVAATLVIAVKGRSQRHRFQRHKPHSDTLAPQAVSSLTKMFKLNYKARRKKSQTLLQSGARAAVWLESVTCENVNWPTNPTSYRQCPSMQRQKQLLFFIMHHRWYWNYCGMGENNREEGKDFIFIYVHVFIYSFLKAMEQIWHTPWIKTRHSLSVLEVPTLG